MSASPDAPIPLEGWQGSTGISGSFQPESVATFARNTHPPGSNEEKTKKKLDNIDRKGIV
jgi:hypothetical protein